MDRKLDKKEIQKKKYKNLLKISSISLGIILCSFIIIPYFKASLIEKDLYFSSVKEENIDLSVPSTGIVKPLYEEVLTAPISARILKIYAKSGDLLNKEDIIMQLDVQHISHDYKNMQDKEAYYLSSNNNGWTQFIIKLTPHINEV